MNVFKQNSHPIALFLAAETLLGEHEWIYWEPEVIAKEINEKIKPWKLSNENFNKLMAMKSLYTTDAIWEHWELFLWTFQALNSLPLNREAIHITDNPLPYLYNTVEILNMARPQEFSVEVKRFCAAIFLHENVHYCPEPLEFAQIFVSQPMYECACGKTGSALPPFNFLCEECSGTYSEEKTKLFNFKPLEIEGASNVKISLSFPIEEIRSRYEELKTKLEANEDIHLEETETDIQVGKLLLSKEYCGAELLKLESEISNLAPFGAKNQEELG